jgi:hypothetical protein
MTYLEPTYAANEWQDCGGSDTGFWELTGRRHVAVLVSLSAVGAWYSSHTTRLITCAGAGEACFMGEVGWDGQMA